MADQFPGPAAHLARYAEVLQATEINSSFHKPHRRATYERWAATTPPGFRFSIKLPKTISHKSKLVGCETLLDAFVAQIEGLGAKLAVVLVQLPPSLGFACGVASPFFAALGARLGSAVAIAAEPRHPSWFAEPADACLAQHQIARVIAHPVLAPGGEQPGGWTGLRYRRLHGAPRLYYSSYDEQRLGALAREIARDRESGAETWCIFDNTVLGAALANATTLRSLLMPQDSHRAAMARKER